MISYLINNSIGKVEKNSNEKIYLHFYLKCWIYRVYLECFTLALISIAHEDIMKWRSY